LMVTHFLGHPV